MLGKYDARDHWLDVFGTDVMVHVVHVWASGVDVLCLVHGWWRSPDLFTCRSC